jgi:hypothetical protein
MLKKQTSGYCRSIVFSVIVILVLCVTTASAATPNTNLVANGVTVLPVTTAAPAYTTCPYGYDCMTESDAVAQLGSYAK